MEKDELQNFLINIGRSMVQENGTDALTVRKLAEASKCSVGAIYNQFSNMDNYIVIQNCITLDELHSALSKVKRSNNVFIDMNNYLQTFVDYVLDNKNLWYMLYTFHLKHNKYRYSSFYLRKIIKIVRIVNELLKDATPRVERPERLLSAQVLWLTMFSLSALLTKDILDSFSKINRRNLCEIVLNTFVAGMTVLENR